MAKKILIISASARKGGNSDLLCDSFMEGAKTSGHNVEKIFINEKKINYCLGCGECFVDTGKCQQKDDMTQIFDKLVEADVIVFATPIYFYTINGQMKTFIDRMCPIYTSLNNKEFYYIMTCADETDSAMNRALEELRGFTFCLKNPSEKGIICGTSLWKFEQAKETVFIDEAFEMGRQIAD